MTPTHFATNLRTIREKRGWSRRQLAERANVHANTIVHLEGGVSTSPKMSTLVALADVLGVSLTALMRDGDKV